MTGANYGIAVVMGICCFLAVAGAPLPWFAADTGFGTVSVSGLSGEIDSVGSWSMIPALVVTGLFVLTLITKRWHLAVDGGHVGDQVLAPLGEQAALVQHAGQHPNGVSAPAVPKQVDLVPWLVAGHEVSVGFPDIPVQTLAGYPHAVCRCDQHVQQTDGSVPQRTVGSNARVVVGDLLRTIRAQPLEQAHHVGVLVRGVVLAPSAVAANHNSFHDPSLVNGSATCRSSTSCPGSITL